MPYATTDDGVRLYYEETGSGTPVVFVHEFAGDYRSWEPQMRHFAQRYRCIAFNARGYPPSDVPEDVAKYSQARAARRHPRRAGSSRSIDKAHIVGLSMGGFATLHFGFAYPDARAARSCVAGCGYGAEPGQAATSSARGRRDRGKARERGHGGVRRDLRLRADARAVREQGPARLRRVQATAWRAFRASARPTPSSACSASGRRCTTWSIEMERSTVPTLVVTGDEDWPCLQPGAVDEAHDPDGGACR